MAEATVVLESNRLQCELGSHSRVAITIAAYPGPRYSALGWQRATMAACLRLPQ